MNLFLLLLGDYLLIVRKRIISPSDSQTLTRRLNTFRIQIKWMSDCIHKQSIKIRIELNYVCRFIKKTSLLLEHMVILSNFRWTNLFWNTKNCVYVPIHMTASTTLFYLYFFPFKQHYLKFSKIPLCSVE